MPSGGAKWKALPRESFLAARWLLASFLAFAFVGYLLNNLLPAEWVPALFGGGRAYGVPLAATLGLPFYLNTEASLPLVRALVESAMGPGAALAFLITGAGTSVGAVAGALTIARGRVVGLVIATLWAGAVVLGARAKWIAGRDDSAAFIRAAATAPRITTARYTWRR